MGGKAIHGPVAQGDQTPLKAVYLEWSKHMSGYPNGLDTSADIDGDLTAQELLDKNPDTFWKKYKESGEDWNFTAQLLLASSYGMMQAMYDTALTRMVKAGIEVKHPANDSREKVKDAVPIEKLFDPDFSVQVGSGYLKVLYNENNKDWLTALEHYNGSGKDAKIYADKVFKHWDNGNGMFKIITQ